MTRPVLGKPAPRRLRRKRLDRHQERVPCSRSQQPATFPCTSRIVCAVSQLVLQASHLRLERAHLRIQRVAFGRFRDGRLLRANSRSEPCAPRLAPSRQMRAVQPLAAKAAHLAGLCAAIRLLQNPQPILCGELAPLRLGHNLRVQVGLGPGGLVARSSTPRAGTETSFNVIESLRGHRFRPPPPYRNSKGCWCLSDVGREGLESERARVDAGGQLGCWHVIHITVPVHHGSDVANRTSIRGARTTAERRRLGTVHVGGFLSRRRLGLALSQ